MNKIELSAIEKEMANYNFNELQTHVAAANAKIASAKNATDVKQEICKIWNKIKPYIKLLEAVPIVGKFVTILAQLLDAICAS